MNDATHVIIPFASHVEPIGGRQDGLAPMVCCILWVSLQDHPKYLLLRGCERSTLAMLARGIVHSVAQIIGQYRDAQIECITESNGIWTMAQEMEGAFQNERMTADALPVWMELVKLDSTIGISKRGPCDPLEGLLVRHAQSRAKTERLDVLADFRTGPERFCFPGITYSSCELAPIHLEAAQAPRAQGPRVAR